MSEVVSAAELVQGQNAADVEALVQAAVSVLTNDMQIPTHDVSVSSIQVSNQVDENAVQLLVDTQEKLYMCTDCNLAFCGESGEQEWRYHLQQHKPNKCELCTESFEEKDSLKLHMRTHSMQMPFICEQCGSAYSLKSNLTQHMKSHEEREIKCIECGVVFKSTMQLNKHMKCHTGEPVSVYQCETCNKMFAHQKNLVQHMKVHYNQQSTKQYKCPECPASYSYKCHLSRHLMIHTGDKPYKCKFCGKAFNRNAHLVRHRKIHLGAEKEWKCSQCGFAFYERSDLLRHIKSHEGNRPFKCEFCEQTFVWKRYMLKHLRSSHGGDGRHYCEDCCECLPSEEAVEEHRQVNHGNKRRLTHTCDICQEEFHFKFRLDEHMFLHTGRKAHECERCGSKFVSRKELDRHIASHGQEVSFSCNTCQKSFVTVEKLREHLKMHTTREKYTCSICHAGFRWKSQLTNHMVIHSADHDYECSICKKEFKRKKDLTRHVKVFHDTKPPYQCSECHIECSSPQLLYEHKQKEHWKKTDEMDDLFSCPNCSGLFKLKSDLEKHILKTHPPRPYVCVLCYKRFSSLKFVTKHFELKHPGVEPQEDFNYELRTQAEIVKDVEQALIPVAGEEKEGDREESVELEMDVADDQQQPLVQPVEHVSNSAANSESINASSRNPDNIIIVQSEDCKPAFVPVPSSLAQHHAPMSDAITLAQFSQQVSEPTFLPEFLEAGSQQGEVQTTPLIIRSPNIIQTSNGNPVITISKDQLVNLQQSDTTNVIKIDKAIEELLMKQQISVLSQVQSSAQTPIKIIKPVQTSGSVVHIRQQPSSATPNAQIPRAIQIMPLSRVGGGEPHFNIVANSEAATTLSGSVANLTHVSGGESQVIFAPLQNVQPENE